MLNIEQIRLFLLVFFISILIGQFLTPLIAWICKKNQWGDEPNERKVHQKKIPNCGGVTFYVTILLTSIFSIGFNQILVPIIASISILTVVGLIDDLKGMRPIIKLLAQVFVAFLTVLFGIKIQFLSAWGVFGVISLDYLSYPMTIFWIVSIINMLNLIDGVDGLATGLTAISSFFLAILALINGQIMAVILALILMGTGLSFLRFNFEPAKIFMGDTGSMIFGYMLAVISILGALNSTISVSFTMPMLILGIPIIDVFLAILRRIKHRQPIYLPDRNHIHHKLLDHGLTHAQVSWFLYIMATALGVFAVLLNQSTGIVFAVLFVSIIFTIYLSLKMFSRYALFLKKVLRFFSRSQRL